MSDWQATNAWGGVATGRFGRHDGGAGVRLRLLEPAALATIIARRDNAGELAARVKARLGCMLPLPGEASFGANCDIVWSAPGQWLVVNYRGNDLAEICNGVAAVTDQGSSRALVEVSGPAAREALAKGFSIDLDQSVFGPGRAAVTAVAHMSVQIWLADATPRFVVAVPRSFASSFWSWLAGASAAYGYDVVAS